MSDVKESITENIKHFRSRMGISQEELSNLCGYSSTYIGKIERGQRSPSLDTLIRIAEALQIPLASLFDPFYRQQSQLKDNWDPSSFSPYDATLRRFNYLVGRLSPDGTLREVFHLPWFQSGEIGGNVTSYRLWEWPVLQLSASARTRLEEMVEGAAEGDRGHLSLKIAGFDFREDPVDLTLIPRSEDSEAIEEIRFELFYPRVVRKGRQIALEDLQFDLTE